MKLCLRDKLIFAPLIICYGRQRLEIECVVDTGSAGTAVDASQIVLDLSRFGILADMIGIGGAHQVLIQQVESVALADAVVPDFPIEFGDFSGRYNLNGIIGGDLLKRLGVTIDYLKDELSCGCA